MRWRATYNDLKEAHASSCADPRLYRRVCLNAPCKFVLLRNRMGMWWHEYKLRERIGQQYRMVYPTSYQRACGVANVIQCAASTFGARPGDGGS